MTRKPAHAQTTSSRSRRAQTALALTVAVTTCLLVLAASASANVDKKYAKAYAGKVLVCTMDETEHRGEYNAYADTLQSSADDLIKVLAMDHSDPGYQTYLDALLDQDNEQAQAWHTELGPESVRQLGVMKALYPRCKDWFSSSADKIVFLSATSQLVRGFALSNKAEECLGNAFDMLALQDVPSARAFNVTATGYITQAEPDIKKGLSKLKGLER